MKMRQIVWILTLTLGLLLGTSAAVSAESYEVGGHCYFDGSDIVCTDFDSDTIAKTVAGLEPGDDVHFKIEFKNSYTGGTQWYMRNEVLKTLEESFDRTENGGYTYILKHIRPDGKEVVLFDNSSVGGDAKPGDMEGLHQATNALDEYFYIQELKTDEKAYTDLYVKFDGETEVNDYMDTAGKLMVAYAVELDKTAGGGNSNDSDKDRVVSDSGAKTGDSSNLLLGFAMMTAALLLALLTILSWRKDRKDGEKA